MRKRMYSFTALAVITAAVTAFTACPVTHSPRGGGTHSVTLTFDNAQGTVTASPAIPKGGMVADNTDVTFTATAKDGYKIGAWTIKGGQKLSGGKQGETSAKVKVTSNVTVNVMFVSPGAKPAVKKHSVTLTFDSSKGSVTSVPALPEGNMLEENTEVTFTATAKDGYKVGTWEIAGGQKLSGGKQGEATATVKVTADVAVNVTFTPVETTRYTVTLTQTPNGTVSADPPIPADGKVDKNTEITFTAQPDDHYRIGEWTINGGTVSEGEQKGSKTAKVKITANTTVSVVFNGTYFDRETGMGAVDGAPFTMKQIEEAKNVTLGSTTKAEGDNQDHTVSLTAYKIGETEVTQDVFKAVTDATPSFFTEKDYSPSKRWPVERVNWYQAVAFCNMLSLKLGLEPCYTVKVRATPVDFSTLKFTDVPTTHDDDWDKTALNMNANGFRLPTEAEWEWAARAGTSTQWPGTDNKNEAPKYVWYTDNSGQKTHEVGTREQNGSGLFDMGGNVAEWCWDWKGVNTPESGKENPTGVEQSASVSNNRVLRGGHWASRLEETDVFTRNSEAPEILSQIVDGKEKYPNRRQQIGFRVVCR